MPWLIPPRLASPHAASEARGVWWGNAVLVAEVGGWTLFADLAGVHGCVPAERWPEFAGYIDAIECVEIVLVRGARAVRVLLGTG